VVADSASSPAYPYLLGLYLGDGYLARHPRDVYKLRVFLDARYPGIVRECEHAINAVLGKARAARIEGSCVEVYAYSKRWPGLFPQHGPGKKHERLIRLEEWQWRLAREAPERLLRGLIHSDGCRFLNTGRDGWRHPRYSFTNSSAGIRAIFQETCGLIGVRWTAAGNKVYVSRKTDVAVLDELVGPKA
jgi:hypothetical protein